jgi:hypothetical protein
MTDKSAAALKKFIFLHLSSDDEWGYTFEKSGSVEALTALIEEHYVKKEEHEKVLRQRDELKEALDRIADPIAYMERNLKEGERLDGMMAIHIANNPEYLKKIAEAAIKSTER